MIGKTSIVRNLQTLDRLYNNANSVRQSLFYSKFAILELCGWIEETMDDVVARCANRNLNLRQNRRYVDKNIIKRVHGFDYHNHFRAMLMQVVGLIMLEKIEKSVNQRKFELMQAALGSLTTHRNTEAHTHLKGTTRRLDAPSMTKNRFLEVYEGLKEFDNELRQLR
jgi:hypothetical protein